MSWIAVLIVAAVVFVWFAASAIYLLVIAGAERAYRRQYVSRVLTQIETRGAAA